MDKQNENDHKLVKDLDALIHDDHDQFMKRISAKLNDYICSSADAIKQIESQLEHRKMICSQVLEDLDDYLAREQAKPIAEQDFQLEHGLGCFREWVDHRLTYVSDFVGDLVKLYDYDRDCAFEALLRTIKVEVHLSQRNQQSFDPTDVAYMFYMFYCKEG